MIALVWMGPSALAGVLSADTRQWGCRAAELGPAQHPADTSAVFSKGSPCREFWALFGVFQHCQDIPAAPSVYLIHPVNFKTWMAVLLCGWTLVAGAISFSCIKHSDLHVQRLKEVFETLVTFWSIFAGGLCFPFSSGCLLSAVSVKSCVKSTSVCTQQHSVILSV